MWAFTGKSTKSFGWNYIYMYANEALQKNGLKLSEIHNFTYQRLRSEPEDQWSLPPQSATTQQEGQSSMVSNLGFGCQILLCIKENSPVTLT